MNRVNIVQHPSIILVTGGRGKGKSALGHYLVEKFHTKREVTAYMLILPALQKKLRKLLPEWINLIEDIEQAPENCIILCDEAALKYHAHKWQKKETEVMDNIISISRQRKQTIIFIAHITRKFSITLLDIDVLICKKPGTFHTLIERSGFKKLIEKAEEEFKKLPKDEVKKANYVYSEDFKGFIHTGLCSYWSEDLSEAFSGVPLEEKEEVKTEEEETKPNRIDGGLKIWFKKTDKDKVYNVFNIYNSFENPINPMSISCIDGKCFWCFDIKRIGDKYYPSCDRYDYDKIFKVLEKEDVDYIIDVESSKFPIGEDEIVLKKQPVKERKKKKKDRLEEYAKGIKL